MCPADSPKPTITSDGERLFPNMSGGRSQMPDGDDFTILDITDLTSYKMSKRLVNINGEW